MFIYIHVKPDIVNDNDNDPLKMKYVYVYC